MRCAAHAQALRLIFDGLAHPLTGPIVMSAKIGITPKILGDYARHLGGSAAFQAWFSAAQAGNRLIIRSLQDAPSSLASLAADSREYGVAMYFSGGRVFAERHSIAELDTAALRRLGFVVLDVQSGPPTDISGDNPTLSLSLISGGVVDFDVLNPFFACEDEILIYDKYIDEAAMQLIEHIATLLKVGANLNIRTTSLGDKCVSIREISRRISAANPKINSSCEEVSVAFRRRAHDRYIFFGHRLQAVFSAGLGCFGLLNASGNRVNKQSKINVYALDGFSPLEIESKGGGKLVVNHLDQIDC